MRISRALCRARTALSLLITITCLWAGLARVARAESAVVPPQAIAATPSAPASSPVAVPSSPAASPPLCAAEYADDFAAFLPRARELEAKQSSYTFCIRTIATYECPYYSADGVLRRTLKQVKAHGTGFGYRRQDGATLLLTNDHVAEWPAATDADHAVDGVPLGCRRISDELRIVDNEADDYERDDIPLTRVVVDPQLDVAVVKARAPLPIIPWKVGKSAALRERNVVNVRGFPLGILNADNVGKVVSVYDHDDSNEWDHDDFVVDALLSPGNSGSPVLAISCKTGELELVGIYHAAYSSGNGLNLVIAIDQVRDLMTTLQRSPRKHTPSASILDGASRAQLVSLASSSPDPFFPLGALMSEVRARPDGRLLFEVLSRDIPARANPLLVIEDVPAPTPGPFGAPGRVWAGNVRGLKELDRSTLDAETQAALARILDALRADSLSTFQYRAAASAAYVSKERFHEATRLHRSLDRTVAARQDLADLAGDLAERLGPKPDEASVEFTSALFDPPPAPVEKPPGALPTASIQNAPAPASPRAAAGGP